MIGSTALVPPPGGRAKKKAEVSLVRSATAKNLTFVAAVGNSEASIEMRYEDENFWVTQKMMATLYDVSVPAIIAKTHAGSESEKDRVVQDQLFEPDFDKMIKYLPPEANKP